MSTTEEHAAPSAPLHERVSVGDQRLGVIHQGGRYLFGFASTFYGIWDQGQPDAPVERFPATAAGRQEAWDRYREMDPAAHDVDPISIGFPAPPVVEQRSRSRALIITGIVAAIVIIAVVALVASKSGSPATKAITGGPGGRGKQAALDVTGATTISQNLNQATFDATGLDSLYPQIKASWTSADTELKMVVSLPHRGRNPTGQSTHNEVDITVSGTTYVSLSGECTVNLDDFSTAGMSGSYSCRGIPPQGASGTPIDAKGTFGATGTS